MVAVPEIRRHRTHAVSVGKVTVGGDAPVVVQSMTNTDTADVGGTVRQVQELAHAGSEIVRITVNKTRRPPPCRASASSSTSWACDVPLVGDFHYNGHRLLAELPDLAGRWPSSASIPAMSASATSATASSSMMVEAALRCDRPVRIGVNWGSLDQDLATRLMDVNARPAGAAAGRLRAARGVGPLGPDSAAYAERIGLRADRIVLSAKVSRVQDLVAVYRELAGRSAYALHVGLTEAGMGIKGIAATAAALALLLQEGIGDTIRASLTPEPDEPRTNEVVACQEVLQALGLRSFMPQVTACPGCGRTTSTLFQELARSIQGWLREQMPVWQRALSGRRDAERRRHGLHRQRPGREQARRYRHQPARHRREPDRPGVHRRQEGADAARGAHRRGVPGARRATMSSGASARPRRRLSASAAQT